MVELRREINFAGCKNPGKARDLFLDYVDGVGVEFLGYEGVEFWAVSSPPEEDDVAVVGHHETDLPKDLLEETMEDFVDEMEAKARETADKE